MNKKGTVVLRDVMFMMLIVSSIIIFASLFISDMANNYDNSDMSNEWAESGTNITSQDMFYNVSEDLNETGSDINTDSTGIWAMITSVGQSLEGLGDVFQMVLLAPNTIGGLISATLLDAGVPQTVVGIIKFTIIGILWGIVIFSIASAFLRGGKI